jgi:hypothetical protein
MKAPGIALGIAEHFLVGGIRGQNGGRFDRPSATPIAEFSKDRLATAKPQFFCRDLGSSIRPT